MAQILDEIEGCVPALRRYARALTHDRDQADDLVRAGGLLDPVRMPRRERRDRGLGLLDAPALVRVDRDPDIGAHHVPGQPQAAPVVVDIGADLQLDLPESVRDRLP